MKRSVFLFTLLFLIAGCGDQAPDGTVVNGPAAASTTVAGAGTVIYRALDFQALDDSGKPLPDIDIEFFSGGVGILTDLDGNALNPSNPGVYKTKTDDRGLGRVSLLATIPACSGTVDEIFTASARGTVRSADFLFTATITLTCS